MLTPDQHKLEYLGDSSCTSLQEHLDLSKTLQTLQATEKPASPTCNNYGQTRFSGNGFLQFTVGTHVSHLTVSIPLFSVHAREVTSYATKQEVIFCLMPPVTAPRLAL